MAHTMSVEVAERSLKVVRTFDFPRELVFQAYTDGDALKQWFGPEGWPLTVSDMDCRVGGVWHYCMTGPDGEQAWGIATFEEITAPERLAYEDAFSDADRNIVPPSSKVTINFIERSPAQTTLEMDIRFASNDERDQVIGMGIEEGMGQTLDHLEQYLATK